MKTRIKLNLPLITTRDEAEAVMNDLATYVNERRKVTADLDAEILSAKDDYAPDLTALDEVIKSTSDHLRAWAEANPAEFPKDRKSIVLASGTLGFRTGTPKLALLSRAFNWERVLALVEQYWPSFIRIKKEVNKEEILSLYAGASNQSASDAELKRLGLKVTQEESFYIEPKLTELTTRQLP